MRPVLRGVTVIPKCLDSLTPEECALLLCTYMADLSEDIWCAGWLTGLEYLLWDWIHGDPDSQLAPFQRDALLRLTEKLDGGWIIWREDKGTVWVTRQEWEEIRREHGPRTEREDPDRGYRSHHFLLTHGRPPGPSEKE